MRRLTAAAAAAAAVCLVLTGCDYRGASSLPLPGGVGGDGYEVTMVFDDVTNLVPKETCRANDVVIGTVASIELRDDLKATVVCRIKRDVKLAGNAVATLRETSLLGERFVALDPPPGESAEGTLAEGATLDEAASTVVPNVEVVFGALSAVLNGGGLSNIDTISRELTAALSESDLGETTDGLARLVGTLDDNRDDIVDALDAVDRLTSSLSAQREAIGTALDSLPAGLAVLERQRPRLVRTLTAVGELSDVALPLIRDTKEATVADLRLLGPILEDLARSKDRLALALEGIITFPFPSYTKYVTKGDYAGMFATISFDLDSFNKVIAAHAPEFPTPSAHGPRQTLLDSLDLPDLPELPLDELLDLLPNLELPDLGLSPGRGLLGRPTAADQQRIGAHFATEPARDLGDLLTGGVS